MFLQIPQQLKAFPASVQVADILLRCIVYIGMHADIAALDKRFATGGTGKGAFASVPTEVDLEIDEDSDRDTVHERSVVDTTSSCEVVRDDSTTGSATRETINNLITFPKKNRYGRNADSPPRDRRDFHERFRDGLVPIWRSLSFIGWTFKNIGHKSKNRPFRDDQLLHYRLRYSSY